MTDKPTELNILSIDAWRDGQLWQWNQWFRVGTIPLADFEAISGNNRAILKRLRADGCLSDYSKGRVAVDDDQYNVVICDRHTGEPHFAIEYGPAYS